MDIRIEQLPATAPRLDLMVDPDHTGDGVKVLIYSHDTKKHTHRTYRDIKTARKTAVFIALTLGIEPTNMTKFNAWLQERGFPPFHQEQENDAKNDAPPNISADTGKADDTRD